MATKKGSKSRLLDGATQVYSTTKKRRNVSYIGDMDGTSYGGVPMGESPATPASKVFDNSFTQWSSSDGKRFIPCRQTRKVLPPGVYEINFCPQVGLYYENVPVKTEGLLRFPETNSLKVVDEIQRFWGLEANFAKYELTYKRGMLLYGPPGSGKSCTVQLLMADVIERGGIVVKFKSPDYFTDGMRAFRSIQPHSPMVVIMEDIDSLIERHCESDILNILDGVEELHKIVFLATTNYPGKLGHRIINRPSRFDKRFEIGFPNSQSRRLYLEHLLFEEAPESLGIDLDKWIKDTSKFSLAHIRELFIAVILLGDKYEDAVKTLREMKEEIDERDKDQYLGFRGTKGHSVTL
jgi:hypothetical protein